MNRARVHVGSTANTGFRAFVVCFYVLQNLEIFNILFGEYDNFRRENIYLTLRPQ